MTNVPDAKSRRELAKKLAEDRRTERKTRKRKCALCGIEESEKSPFVAHPDGLGPTCRETMSCDRNRSMNP